MPNSPETIGRSRVESQWSAGGSRHGIGVLLAPLEHLFRAGVAARNTLFDRRVLRCHTARVPVISVGNLTVGGAGKTPFSAHLSGMLQDRGHRVALLHGGYAMDEPALHREWRPDVDVVVGRDRVRTAELATLRGATVIVLDDGFQHRRLARDLDIVLVAAEGWTTSPRLLPRGPWREAPKALSRAGLIVVTRRTASAERAGEVLAEAIGYGSAAGMIVALRPAGWWVEGEPADAPVDAVSVSAIAGPAQFEANAVEAGATLSRSLRFADHHVYGEADAARILAAAGGGPIVTTEKDAVKLRRLLPAGRLTILRQGVAIETGGERLDSVLDSVLGSGMDGSGIGTDS